MVFQQGRSQLPPIMAKGGSFLIRMGVAYICLYKFVYIKFSKRWVLQNPPPGYAPVQEGQHLSSYPAD